jgi:hypothetical protein
VIHTIGFTLNSQVGSIHFAPKARFDELTSEEQAQLKDDLQSALDRFIKPSSAETYDGSSDDIVGPSEHRTYDLDPVAYESYEEEH